MLNEFWSASWGWLLRTSAEVSLVILMLLLIRWISKRHLPARWQAALWVLLAVRMLMPAIPALRVQWSLPLPPSAVHVLQSSPIPRRSLEDPPNTAVHTSGRLGEATSPAASFPLLSLIPAVWFTGFVAVLLLILATNFRLWMAVRKGVVVTSEPVLRLFEDCKRVLGIRTLVGVVETNGIPTPAIFGFLRPRLLLPPSVFEILDEEDLKHVFLHELAHLKRMDIYWGWLSAFLQALHWFNPLVWYAFHQHRKDRELACDELAVSTLAPQDASKYGHTLLKLQVFLGLQKQLPSFAGVTENPEDIKQRIKMISRLIRSDKRQPRRWTLFSGLAFSTVSIAALATQVGVQHKPQASHQAQHVPNSNPHPFVNDPAALGAWRAVAHVASKNDFDPQKQASAPEHLREVFIKPGGHTNLAFTWTKGLLLPHGHAPASVYEIRTIGADSFMFVESRPEHGSTLSYDVLKKEDRMAEVESRRVDRTDYPFVDDPDVHGHWACVGHVDRPEDFTPGKHFDSHASPFRGVEILPNGKTDGPWTWTRGLLLNPKEQTAGRYQVRSLNGVQYLFFEWKGAEYVHHGHKPSTYVLVKHRA